MPNNKVKLSDGTVLIDLSKDTVISEVLANGYKAHDKTGNIITGTAIINPYAVISVTYPENSICTCTNGIKTFKATNTSTRYLFMIPEADTWTVSCTNGTKKASKTVIINSQYQTESVTLMYNFILYEKGSLGEGVSIKYNNQSSFVVGTGTFGGKTNPPTNTQLSFLPLIKPNQFKTLFITLNYNNTSARYSPGIGVLPSSNENGYTSITKWDWPAITRLSTGEHEAITAKVDLSKITENVYIYFQTAYTTGTISKIWLE